MIASLENYAVPQFCKMILLLCANLSRATADACFCLMQKSEGIEVQNTALENLERISRSFSKLIFEKGSGSELTVRLRQVESGLEQLRETIRLIPDIQNNEQRQRDKIASLYSAIEGSLNEQRLVCGICGSVVLLAGVGRWSNREEVLPLCRQQKDVATQKVVSLICSEV
ncbi:hypothetical protein NECAME_02104 [Necator americanus]|uniref:Uncharacterized protein n=1 Tax=Necator americanus TaxID=51031 RepID=W2TJM9_NECAM|nr:hypothetical protein NECAME_02104 [Necator americanus]ETN81814.1 hypothetical protein NECAME_02104 [Necator americanus]